MILSDLTPDDETTKEVILRFLEGDATAREIASLHAWLELHEDNRRYFDEVNTTFQATVTVNRFNHRKVDDAWNALSQKIASEKEHIPAAAKTVRFFIPWKAAAAVALLAVSSYLVYRLMSVGEDTLPGASIVRSAQGSNTRILLPDGSVVWLNANSTLEYPVKFGEASREVKLKGEGFFDVRKGSKPFIVHADELQVRVKGTRFNVEAYADAPTLKTTLEEGKVELHVADQGQIYVMKPGEQIVVHKTDAQVTRTQVDPADFSAWKEEKLVFDNERLDDIVSKLENRYKVSILVESIGAKGERMSMTIEHETLDEVLDLIQLSSRLRVKKERNRIILFE
jgi:ferric-dicitrate binding protein FerR (iron transport regulator)